MATAIFAAGCFWGVEAWFERIDGVVETKVGYTGGKVDRPYYELVKTGKTGHAESIKIDYDASVISYQQLVDAFFECHDPTSKNRQGEDVGSQYRSVIFYLDESQRYIAEEKIKQWNEKGVFKKSIVTEVAQAGTFYDAEEYHQKYLQKNGSAACGIV
ncbi:peptide-methionine (S)-S-oxide reductase MsrA [Thalassobacillus hwangdonensis]|uniref:Peptide methionine sulfoxide reductase MsrA n=1 Tax=Thalassobacillus hwangdonensis TaxID=546108 RepID=A0ABW3L413_9BACI